MDRIDLGILNLLQEDATLSSNEIARRLDVPPTSCWRRVKALEEAGIIRKRVALVDPDAVGVGTVAFVFIRTGQHEPSWLKKFAETTKVMPEIVEVHRLSGDTDYLLKVLVPDIAGYDAFYKRLIASVPLFDVSTSFSMERVKETSAVPLHYARRRS